jgi:methylphosphotriester-DNA--protein-cysteine methyltransferase
MDRNLVSQQEHEIEYLARKHGTTVEKVKEIIKQTGSRSRKQIEEALDQHFQHQPTRGQKEHAE